MMEAKTILIFIFGAVVLYIVVEALIATLKFVVNLIKGALLLAVIVGAGYFLRTNSDNVNGALIPSEFHSVSQDEQADNFIMEDQIYPVVEDEDGRQFYLVPSNRYSPDQIPDNIKFVYRNGFKYYKIPVDGLF